MNSNQKDILVSIVIPIYNVEKYIEKCIDSVINQTWKCLEIICVNDGTQDSSIEIIRRKAVKDSRIHIVNIENSGLSVARNMGIEKATGKYIYFLDSDDWLSDDAIELLVDKAEKNNLDVLMFNAECIFESEQIAKDQSDYAKYYLRRGKYPGAVSGEELFILMVRNGDFKPSACLVFINRDYLQFIKLRFYPGILHEDNLFTILLMISAGKVMFFDQQLYKRLVRKSSITSEEKNVKHAYGFFVCHREIMRTLPHLKYTEACFCEIQNYLKLMQKNALINIKNMNQESIKREIKNIEPEAEGFFLDYIYGAEKYYEMQAMERKVTNNIVYRGLRKLKRTATKIRNKIKGLMQRISEVNQIPYLKLEYWNYRRSVNANKEKICVSIIVPVYNVEKYLSLALDSLTKQTLRNIEIICINDGSTDKSLEILKDYQERDVRIKVLQQENLGAGAARNLGMDVAVGEYLLFLDSDDIFNENLCDEVYFQCIKKNADLCLYGAKRLNMQTLETELMGWVLRKDKIPRNNLFSGKQVGDYLFQLTSGCPWSKMYRREFILKNGLRFQELHNTNDAYFVRMSLALADRITTVNKSYVTYRYNEGNNIQSNKSEAPLEFYRAFKAIKLELIKRGLFDIYERTYCNMVLKESLFNLQTVGSVEAQELIKKLLKSEAIEFFGVKNHPEDYYYEKNEYIKMKRYF